MTTWTAARQAAFLDLASERFGLGPRQQQQADHQAWMTAPQRRDGVEEGVDAAYGLGPTREHDNGVVGIETRPPGIGPGAARQHAHVDPMVSEPGENGLVGSEDTPDIPTAQEGGDDPSGDQRRHHRRAAAAPASVLPRATTRVAARRSDGSRGHT